MRSSSTPFKSGMILFFIVLFSWQSRAEVTPGDSIHAAKYTIILENIDVGAQTITASTNITLVPLVDNLDIFQLQLMQLTVDSVFVNMVKITNFVHADEVLNIPLSSLVSIGDTTDVLVYYHGQPFHESWGGFHYSGSYAFNLGVGISWIPHNLGKTWFPCIDDFTDRASYEVIATVPEDQTAVGGGTLMGITNNGNGTRTFRWLLNNPIPTYLASITVGSYKLVSDSYMGIAGEVPINYYVRPSDTLKVPGSFSRIKEILAVYEGSFGAYDWPRIGYIGTAIGAMEHATNIAYPNFCINGNSGYEDLYAHELSHMWFGDKVTCDKAEEMWINEGWATFCQNYYIEVLDGVLPFKESMRNMHNDVLYSCHTEEGGYVPLNNIPQEYTYGTSAYDKGATVVQALRAYLGDAVFFDACEDYLEDLAFTSISSYDMEVNFAMNTGVDMSGFFNNWVYNGGTPHYSIDSFSVTPQGGSSLVSVYLRQKRKGPAFIGDLNRIEVNVMGNLWQRHTQVVEFSGETGSATFNAPFEAVEVFLDLEERYMDATVDNYNVVATTGEVSFSDTQFSLDVQTVTDSAFIQVTHNYAPADTFATPVPYLRVSDYRYWTIRGIVPEPFEAIGRFFYSKSGLDNTLITSDLDSLVILYREDAGMAWEQVDFTKIGPWSIGYIYVDNVQMGEYVLGVWDVAVGVDGHGSLQKDNGNIMEVFPNPSSGKFNFAVEGFVSGKLEIYSLEGKLIEQIEAGKQILWEPDNALPGTYVAILRSEDGQALSSRKIVYTK